MFEYEVGHVTLPGSTLPEAVRKRFAEGRDSLTAIALLPWEEHCTECAMPDCYATCDLYEARKDGKCRRFHNGFGEVEGAPSAAGHVASVSFKRWGQLMAYANTHMVPYDRARRTLNVIRVADRVIAAVPDAKLSIAGRAGVSSRLMRRVKQQVTHSARLASPGVLPDNFLVEVYNPQPHVVNLSLVIRDFGGDLADRPFQQLLELATGFNRIRIPFGEIRSHIHPDRQFHVSLNPNLLEKEDEGLTLCFGLVSFVSEKTAAPEPVAAAAYEPGVLESGVKHVKVLAWDLDNTLWSGVLVEDGEERLVLREGVADVIRELDRRGIVNSVVSKNDREVALPVLKRFGLEQYFVFPQISWEPKSQSVAELVAAFNVGANTISVIDDSPFERAEISERCAGVRVYKEDQYRALLDLPEFRPPLSDESHRRRAFYQTEEVRHAERSSFAGDYLSFLRDSHMQAIVSRTTSANVDRAHELIQRTNQLNFSGNRYTRETVQELVDNPGLLPLSIHCADRFGDYGLVGFCVLEKETGTIRDLMFSCRVQAKHVEHALLTQLMSVVRGWGRKELRAFYTRTAKNGQAARVFDDLGFRLVEQDEARAFHIFGYDVTGELPSQDVVNVAWEIPTE